jgi:predicted phage terminase large subunit-like protein
MSQTLNEALREANQIWGVDDYLNATDYSIHPEYVPSDFALEFVNFIKLVNGEDGEENKTPLVHYYMLDTLTNNGRRILNMCHRGIAKTTVMGEYLFLYIATYGTLPGFGKVTLALYVSDSIENGVKNMRKNLEHRWENSDFLKRFVPTIRFTDIRWEFVNADGHKFIVKGYGAKALSLDSELHTLEGRITIGECKVGDRIFGADGKLTVITAKSEVFHKPMYELELEDGRTLKVSEDHYNPVVVNTSPNGIARWEEKVLTTAELLEQPLTHTKKGNKNHRGTSTKHLVQVKNIEPLEYPHKEFPVDPYTLGVVLGDGCIRKECGSVELTVHADELSHYHQNIPYEFGALYCDKRSSAVTQSIRGLGRALKKMGLNVRGEMKFIPAEYFYGSIQQRLDMLQGLLDTDGTISKTGRISFTSSSYQLCEDVACLVRSLGGSASKIRKQKSSEAYRVEIWMKLNPFRLSRKAERFVPKEKRMNVVAVRRIPDEPSQCIAVDNEERQFVANCYFRTHNTGVRGAKEMGQRPQLAVLDDLISDEDARSATVISAVEDTVYKAVTYALHPAKNLIIWSGTPFNAKDPLYKAVESGAWAVNVFPVCEKFPCSREEFRGSWPDRFTYDYVKEQYESALKLGKVDTFNQELMLRIMSEEDRLIEDGDIGWYKRALVLSNRHRFNFYITTDFATSQKTSADFSVISVWAYNNNGDWLWVDGVCRRQLMDKNIDDLFRLAQEYRPQQVGIEVTGQQGGFVQWIQEQMLVRNIFFPLASEGNTGKPGIRPNTNKLVRFNTMVPLFKAHKIFFPIEKRDSPEIQEALEELTLASKSGFKSKHDDFIDTISMLSSLTPWKPTETGDLVAAKGQDYWELDIEPEDNSTAIDSYIV